MLLWRDNQVTHQPCRLGTSADQVTLQDAVLELLIPSFRRNNASCLTFCGEPYCLNDCASNNNCTPARGAPWDWSKGTPNTDLSNACYAKWMTSAGKPVNHRSAHNICLLPKAVRFNTHDLRKNDDGSSYRPGDPFYVPRGFFRWWPSSMRELIFARLNSVTRGGVISSLTGT